MSVKSKPVDKCESKEFGLNLNSGYHVDEVFLPKKAKETEILDGTTDEIVDQLTDILKNKIKVG